MIPRIPLLATLAISLAACGQHTGSNDDPATASPGLIGAWRQFLELDTSSPSSAPVIPRSAPAAGSARAAHSALAGEVDQVTDQIRAVYTEASSFITGFPSAEDGYRTVPAKFTEQADKIRENKGNADAETVRRRLTQLSAQANEMLERQRTRFTTLQATFNQKLESVTKSTADMEQRCGKIQGVAGAPQDEAQACSRFFDANSMIKAKSDLVVSGFAQLDQAYQETRQTLQDLAKQPTAAPPKK